MFHERVKAFQTWQHAQQMLAKKREAVDRWEATGRSDKVAPAKDEVLEVRGVQDSKCLGFLMCLRFISETTHFCSKILDLSCCLTNMNLI